MPLSSGERSALWRKRQREDPEKYRAFKIKERDRYYKRKEQGQIRSIRDQSEREKRKTRRNWRKNQQAKRNRDKAIIQHVEQSLTPPDTPEFTQENQNEEPRRNPGRKKMRTERAKAYREIVSLRVMLDTERRQKEKYKKREYRLRKSLETDFDKVTKKILNKEDKEKTRKSLTLHLLMVRKIKAQYDDAKTLKEKSLIRDLIWKNSLLRKYRLGKFAEESLGVKRPVVRRREKKQSKLKEIVTAFFDREDNTRPKAGKKATVTRNGRKMQIRLLNDTLKNIHAKFLSENDSRMSYSLFCKLKPFWVMKPSEKDRQTCLCKLHENTQFKINRLFHEKIIRSRGIEDALKDITCSLKNKTCMYRECLKCKDKSLQVDNVDGRQVSWFVWKTVRIEQNAKGDSESTKQYTNRVMKERESGTTETLVADLMKDLNRIGRHIFNIQHQYRIIKNLIENLNETSALVHIDFSENYNCKYESEIQSMHFGASQRQISIHTGIAYTKHKKIPFSTFSDNLKHSPAAVWAHLNPILTHLKQEYQIDTIHFLSDGPTTQYRSKFNFFILSVEIFDKGFKYATWNFLEAGHGKGAPDGIGAAIKRQADSLVNTKMQDIMQAKDLIEGLRKHGTSIMLFVIDDKEIEGYEKRLNGSIRSVPDTMKIHQVMVIRKHSILTRVLSCFCAKDCSCYEPGSTYFQAPVSEGPEIQTNVSSQQTPASEDQSDVGLFPVVQVDESLIGKFCVVVYEGLPYPGLILDVDDDNEVEIKVMCRIGPNRFFWPLIEDRLWYSKTDIIALLDNEPAFVTKRHQQIEPGLWKIISKTLNLDANGKKM